MQDIFSHLLQKIPMHSKAQLILKAARLDTPLGTMVVLADEKKLYMLDFLENKKFENKLVQFVKKSKAQLVIGTNKPIHSIRKELKQYFQKKLKKFKTPTHFTGTLFQQTVWKNLEKIPHGKTKSYLQLAESIKKPTAFRAVANANGKNSLAIIIPCHRVINTNGHLGGYSSGIARKKWLLEHEGNTI